MSEKWIEVARSASIVEGSAIEVVINGNILAIFRDRGELFAIDGMCSHQGGPLAEGNVANRCVTCPWHGWQYELETGIQTINRQLLQTTFPVRESEGRIEVNMGDGNSEPESNV